MLRLAIGLLSFSIVACGSTDSSVDAGDDASPGDSGMGMDSAKPDTGVDAGSCLGQCVPAPPMGWKLVAYDDKNRNPCPSGFDTSTDLVENIQAADATCACNCSVQTPPTCNVQAATLVFATDANCQNIGNVYNLTGNTCTNGSLSQSGNANIYAYGKQQTQIQGGACGQPMTMKSVPTATSQQGRECAFTSTYSTCKTGVCVPDPGGSFGLCIEHDGDQSCPTGYTKLHSAGTGIDDTRDCDTCTCNLTATCSTASAALYTPASCGGNATNVPLNGTCTQVGVTSVTYASYQVTSTPNNTTCSGVGGGPIGEAALKNQRTICCR
jgi:hypothetical protein